MCKYNKKTKIFVLKYGNKALENNKIGRIKEQYATKCAEVFFYFFYV